MRTLTDDEAVLRRPGNRRRGTLPPDSPRRRSRSVRPRWHSSRRWSI